MAFCAGQIANVTIAGQSICGSEKFKRMYCSAARRESERIAIPE
jgi:hypothetical protein